MNKTCEERQKAKSEYYRFSASHAGESREQLIDYLENIEETIRLAKIERRALRAQLKRAEQKIKQDDAVLPDTKAEEKWS